ncbi:AAA family ATPase [Rhodococcus hoagii]|nr:AAA family ATPase [Prescottella equi]
MTATIYAFCNQKGGVGKTTVPPHRRRSSSRRPQSACRRHGSAGQPEHDPHQGTIHPRDAGIADVLSDRSEATLGDIISEGLWPGSNSPPPSRRQTLAAVRDELVIAGAGREHRLRDALDAVRNNYDLNPHRLPAEPRQLTINALVAADQAVIVSQSALFSANGLARLRRTIDASAAATTPRSPSAASS